MPHFELFATQHSPLDHLRAWTLHDARMRCRLELDPSFYMPHFATQHSPLDHLHAIMRHIRNTLGTHEELDRTLPLDHSHAIMITGGVGSVISLSLHIRNTLETLQTLEALLGTFQEHTRN